ncbi:DNA transposase [Frankliniella fusca]|uniref:DNA transposase n=1 Tax=Frankliniella fusca TaxID=407009 RepID=A0AAE1HR90_9NEOP|nr:DNA transposase [Frankliniella fusca]
MFIEENLQYNIRTDKIEGYEDFGFHGRTHKTANHTLVFMVQGVEEELKFPVGYYPVNATCPSDMLAILIPDVVRDLQRIGFEVLSTISDQGSTNVGAVNILRSMCPQGAADPVYCIDGKIMTHLWDTPHVLKNIRNNLLTSNLYFGPGQLAQWKHIIEYFKLDESICKTSSLSYAHLCPTGKNKMRVKLATQVLSQKVASAMVTFSHLKGEQLGHWQPTAQFVGEIDVLLDSLNGPGRKDKPKEFRCQVTEHSCHHNHWREARKKVKEWVYIRKEGGQRHVPPCLEALQSNLIGYERVRQTCRSNSDPTVSQFVAGIKTAIDQNVTTAADQGNCQDDGATFMATFADLLEAEVDDRPEQANPTLRRGLDKLDSPLPTPPGMVARQGVSLTCMTICSKLIAATERCTECLQNLTTQEITPDIALALAREEMVGLDKPSPALVHLFTTSETEINKLWKEIAWKKKVAVHCDGRNKKTR